MRIANYLRPDCVALRQRADGSLVQCSRWVTTMDGR